MSEKEKQVSVQKLLKIVYITVSLVVLVMSLWIIFDCFKKSPDSQELLVSYNSNTTVDYKVYLKPNRFYDRKYLDKDKKYISNIIDYIDVDFSYLFNSSKPASSNYYYNVTATISSDYELSGTTSELWSKNYTVKPTKSETKKNTNGIRINDKIKIDYLKYDNLAKQFKDEYGVVADTKLTININLGNTAKVENVDKSISDKKNVTLVMPLNKAVTDINISGATPTNNNITRNIVGTRNVNYVLLVGAVILLLISAPICGISLYKLFKITNVSQYIVQQKRILKGYGDIIAEVTTKPDLFGLKIIEVKEFEDLINIEEELRVPILFYELNKEDESWFIITTGNQAYRYILKSSSHIS